MLEQRSKLCLRPLSLHAMVYLRLHVDTCRARQTDRQTDRPPNFVKTVNLATYD